MSETKCSVDIPKTNRIFLRDLHDSIKLCYSAKRKPVMIWGAPGTAKSAHVQQFSKEMDLPYFDIRLAHYDPVDIKGIPYIDTVNAPDDIECDFIVEDDGGKVRKMKVTKFAPPNFLPMTPAIICLEELPCALPSIQIIASRLLLDRNFDGGWRAHKDTQFIATGNRRSDRSGANALLMNLDNRVVHYEVQPDLDYWLNWILVNYNGNENAKLAAMQVVTFMKYMPHMSFDFNADNAFTDSHGYPTYRSWHMVLDILESAYANGMSSTSKILQSAVAGCVGLAASDNFFKFLDIQEKLPNIDKILSGKEKFEKIPDKLDLLYAFIGAIAYKTTPKNMNIVWKIVDYFGEGENPKPEWAMLLVILANKFCKEFGKHEKIDAFIMDHSYVVYNGD